MKSPFPDREAAQSPRRNAEGACSAGLGISFPGPILSGPATRGKRDTGRKPSAAEMRKLHKYALSPSGLPGLCLMGVTERGDNRVVTGELCSFWPICYFISVFLNKCPEARATTAVG